MNSPTLVFVAVHKDGVLSRVVGRVKLEKVSKQAINEGEVAVAINGIYNLKDLHVVDGIVCRISDGASVQYED